MEGSTHDTWADPHGCEWWGIDIMTSKNYVQACQVHLKTWSSTDIVLMILHIFISIRICNIFIYKYENTIIIHKHCNPIVFIRHYVL